MVTPFPGCASGDGPTVLPPRAHPPLRDQIAMLIDGPSVDALASVVLPGHQVEAGGIALGAF